MKSIFQKLIKENKLAHGYIFFGPDVARLEEFANWLVGEITSEPQQGLASNASMSTIFDTLIIQPKENSIGIDQIREIKNFLWQKPIQSTKRTVVINLAHLLTTEAQNAILKIAEEPPSHALIILLVNNLQVLLPTITSRFQKFFLPSSANPPSLLRQGFGVLSAKASEGIVLSNLSARKYVTDFLKGDLRQRKQIIKDVLEQSSVDNDSSLSDFIKLLMLELDKNPIKNWRALKELLHRWQLINQYNVNKRLQLEIIAQVF